MFNKKEAGGEEPKANLVTKVKARIDKTQRMFLMTNVLLTLIFAVNSVWNMISTSTKGAIQYVTIALLAAYVVAFVVLCVLFRKDSKNLKENMKNYKFAIKVMKKVVNIMTLAISLSIMVEAFTIDEGPGKIFALVAAIFGIVSAIIKFIMFVVKFVKKKKKAARKEAKKAAKASIREERTERLKGLLKGNNDVASDAVISDEDEK